MSTQDLNLQFRQAVYFVRHAKGDLVIDDETKLLFYAYFKQATVGNCNTSQPWAIQVVERAKWNAWNSLKNMDCETAKQEYVKLLTKLGDWQSHSLVTEMPNDYQV